MTEGSSTVKTKRMGARFFKNPPQPHMCIRDSLKGSPDPCYINVLSWDKVALGMSTDVPLYGGMKVCPPRTEKKEVSVFAVMANPAILKLHGKNAQNPKERSRLIDILLDFVEKMNEGVVFNRRYTVLRDRDITGELKEIWMVVQSERAKAQQTTGTDELRRPVPQYPYYQEQQQQQQQSQLQLQQQHQMQQQMQQHSMPQHHQHPQQHPQQHQQQQLQHPHEDQGQKRIQFNSNSSCRRDRSDWFESYEKNCEIRNMIISRNTKKYVQYDNNTGRIDHYIFREPIVLQNPQLPQQNCLNYPAYQYQQLPGPMNPQFQPNIHPNASLNCPPPHGTNPMNLIRPESPMHYNKMPIDKFYENFHRMPPPMQPQQPQISMGPPSGYYEAQNPPPQNYLRMLRPQEPQEIAGRPSSHITQTKPIIMVDPRDALVVPPSQLPTSEEVAAIAETSGPRVPPLQSQHFANVSNNVINPPINPSINPPMNLRINSSMNLSSLPRDQNPKKPSTISIFKLYRPQDVSNTQKDVNNVKETNTNAVSDTNDSKNSNDDASDSRDSSTSRNSQQFVKHKFNHNKYGFHEKNSANGETTRSQQFKYKDRTSGKYADVEERLSKNITESEINGDADKERNNSAKIASALRILVNVRRADQAKKKNNGQVKLLSGKDNGEEVLQVYTILRKSEATTSQEDVTSNIEQLAIKDCAETTSEVAAVIS